MDRICPSSARVEKFWDAVNGTVQFLSSSLFPSMVMEPQWLGLERPGAECTQNMSIAGFS